MFIQLRLQFIRLVKQWRLLLFLFIFPLVLLTVLYPFLSSAFSESAIPIGWVDHDDTEFSRLVFKRVQENERLYMKPLEKDEAIRQVHTGELEAAFLIEAGFSDQIKTGEADETVRWIRSETSALDAFAKEKVAAEAIRLMMNSKAAVFAAEYQENISWENIFTQADSYWEPQPLFRMDFNWKSSSINQQESVLPLPVQGILSFLLLYLMGIAVFLQNQRFQDQEKRKLERIRLVSGQIHFYHGAWYFLQLVILVIICLAFFLAMGLVLQVSVPVLVSSFFRLITVVALVHVLLFVISTFIKAKRLFFSISAGLILASFLFGGMPLEGLDVFDVGKWLPHGWLLELIWRWG